MKKIALFLGMLACCCASAVAGPLVALPVLPNEVMPSALYRDHELFFDLYGNYIKHFEDDCSCDGRHDGYGGGIAVGTYFAYYMGARFDATFSSVEHSKSIFSGDLMFRYPIPETPLAPYAFIGGGFLGENGNHGFFRAGAGLEYRITPRFGIFGEGSYSWISPDSAEDDTIIKVGVRLVY